MATVTTPAGDVLEGVHGDLLAYYRGEGYLITEDSDEPVTPAVEVPVVPGASANKAELAQHLVETGQTELTPEELVAQHTKDELVQAVQADPAPVPVVDPSVVAPGGLA
jgi:hypothetical protein